MVQAKMDMTVVMFIVTKQPYHSINPDVLQSRAVLGEIQDTCEAIEKQIGDKLYMASASSSDHHLPDLNQFVDEYWRLAPSSHHSNMENQTACRLMLPTI
jgi:glycogen(starch) synthase